MTYVPWASSEATRKSMLGNRRRDTLPELAVRRMLHAQGLRYRVDLAPLKGYRRRADVVFTRSKIAVFIDGCFWHGCAIHYRVPGTNSGYWEPKIARNVERDAETTVALGAAGWRVLRYWEHQEPAEIVDDIVRELAERLAAQQAPHIPASETRASASAASNSSS